MLHRCIAVWIIPESSKVHDQRSHLANFHVVAIYCKICFLCQTQPYDSLLLLFVVKRILALLVIGWNFFLRLMYLD